MWLLEAMNLSEIDEFESGFYLYPCPYLFCVLANPLLPT